MAAHLCTARRQLLGSAAAAAPVRGVVRVSSVSRSSLRVVAFTSSGNGKQSVEDMNKLLGKLIADAAAHVGTLRVHQYNSAVGKYVAAAGHDFASGKLALKGAPKPVARK